MNDGTEGRSDGATEGKPKGVRPRKRLAVKPEMGRRSLNLRIDDDVYDRLHVHALMERSTVSDLVSRLAREGLRAYAIHKLATRDGGSGGV